MVAEESTRLEEFSIAVRGSSLKRLRKVTESFFNWRPRPDAMSFADIAFHLIEADKWLFEKLTKPDIEPFKASAGSITISFPEEYFDLLSDLERTGRKRAALISSLSRLRFDELMYDARYDKEVSVWWIIVRGNLDHETHHRGQLATYLGIAGLL